MSLCAVVLAGGLGTRLRSLTKDRYPKPMVPVPLKDGSHPFLEFVLEHLRAWGVTEIVVCLGHLGEQIPRHFGDGRNFGLNIDYDDAGAALTGTRVIRAASRIAAPEFLVVCGDTYHPMDLSKFMASFDRSEQWLAQLAVCKRPPPEFANVCIAQNGRVTTYAAGGVEDGATGLETGTLALRREALELFDPVRDQSLNDDIYPALIQRRALGSFTSDEPFFDIGTVAGYREFCAFAAAGGAMPLPRAAGSCG